MDTDLQTNLEFSGGNNNERGQVGWKECCEGKKEEKEKKSATAQLKPRLLERVDLGGPSAQKSLTDAESDSVMETVRTRSRTGSLSSMKSVTSGGSVELELRGKYWRKGEKRAAIALSSESENDEEGAKLAEATGTATPTQAQPNRWVKSTPKRGRGRPPTTGQYVGLGKHQAELIAEKVKEQRLQAEEQLAAYTITAKEAREERAARLLSHLSLTRGKEAVKTSAVLDATVQEALDVVVSVAEKSGHLKGTFVKALKSAADSIKGAVAELRTLTVTEEVVRLEAANAQLSRQVAELHREVVKLRDRPAAPAEPDFRHLIEEVSRSNREQFSMMLNARLEGIECRLLPEPRLRPPLAADHKAAQAASRTAAAGPATQKDKGAPAAPPKPAAKKSPATAATAGVQSTEKSGKSKRPKRGSLAAQEAASERQKPPPLTETTATSEPWSKVVGKKAKKTANKAASGRQPSRAVKEAKKAAPKRKLRPPRTAAITITLKPDAVEKGIKYDSVLADARSRISLGEIGLTELRFRTAVTGARMLEIPPGIEEPEKAADALAGKLREVLSSDVVHIHRPVKCVEIRVSELDDSVTANEVVAAVAREADCATENIKPGVIARGLRGLGSLWLSCPVTAAKKIVEAGRLRVGWVSARVVLLEPRPLRCYRCLETGHVGAKCDTGVDRSNACFRCGKPGHKSRECAAADASCAICETAGKPSGHTLGGKSCCGGKTSKGRKIVRRKAGEASKAPQQSQPQVTAAETMEITQ